MSIILAAFLSGLTAAAAPLSTAPATAPSHHLVATADSNEVPESSGVVASRVNPDVYWTHNDSGDGPFVYAFRLAKADRAGGVAHLLGKIELTGARNVDWEDIAWGPWHMIYLFDGGDNSPCRRNDKRIYRFVEPRIDANGPRFKMRLRCESMAFEYPDPQHPDQPVRRNEQRYDAECLIVQPASGDLYIVTKRDFRKVPIARVYKFPGPRIQWNKPGALHVLEFVVDITPRVRTGARRVDDDQFNHRRRYRPRRHTARLARLSQGDGVRASPRSAF